MTASRPSLTRSLKFTRLGFGVVLGLGLTACSNGSTERETVVLPAGGAAQSPGAAEPATTSTIATAQPPGTATAPAGSETGAGMGEGMAPAEVEGAPTAEPEEGAVEGMPGEGVMMDPPEGEDPTTGGDAGPMAVVAGDGGAGAPVVDPPAEQPAGGDGGTPAPPPDNSDCGAACQAAGGTCEGGNRCVFDCSAEGACAEEIRCPDNYSCTIDCTGDDSCAELVVCPENGADECDVNCGQDACKKGVECHGTTCDVSCANGGCRNEEGGLAVHGGATNFTVDCSGDGSCYGGLECNAENCTLRCNGSGACMGGDVSMNTNNGDLDCNGNGSCESGVWCNGNCDISCNTGAGACGQHCSQGGAQGCP